MRDRDACCVLDHASRTTHPLVSLRICVRWYDGGITHVSQSTRQSARLCFPVALAHLAALVYRLSHDRVLLFRHDALYDRQAAGVDRLRKLRGDVHQGRSLLGGGPQHALFHPHLCAAANVGSAGAFHHAQPEHARHRLLSHSVLSADVGAGRGDYAALDVDPRPARQGWQMAHWTRLACPSLAGCTAPPGRSRH